jgi:hypothetical protein
VAGDPSDGALSFYFDYVSPVLKVQTFGVRQVQARKKFVLVCFRVRILLLENKRVIDRAKNYRRRTTCSHNL